MLMRQTSKHRQTQCLLDLSNNAINNSAYKRIILGGDYNCALPDSATLTSVEEVPPRTKLEGVISEFNSIHDLVDVW